MIYDLLVTGGVSVFGLLGMALVIRLVSWLDG